MVLSRVLPRKEEYAGQVVIGFPFGEDPAGQSLLLACTTQSSGVPTGISIRGFPVAVYYGDESGAVRFVGRPAFDLLSHLSLAADTVDSDGISRPFP